MAKKDGAEKGEEKGAGGAGKTIMIVAVAMLLSAGVGAGGYFLGSSKASNAPAATAEGGGSETGSAAPQPDAEMGPLVKMESFIVNILDDQGSRYLKATINLELSSDEAADEVGTRDAQIRDAILLLIGSKTLNELSDLQGKLQLRADLMGRINSFLTTGKVRKIYFTEFVVQ